jgi:hypothetical protein
MHLAPSGNKNLLPLHAGLRSLRFRFSSSQKEVYSLTKQGLFPGEDNGMQRLES